MNDPLSSYQGTWTGKGAVAVTQAVDQQFACRRCVEESVRDFGKASKAHFESIPTAEQQSGVPVQSHSALHPPAAVIPYQAARSCCCRRESFPGQVAQDWAATSLEAKSWPSWPIKIAGSWPCFCMSQWAWLSSTQLEKTLREKPLCITFGAPAKGTVGRQWQEINGRQRKQLKGLVCIAAETLIARLKQLTWILVLQQTSLCRTHRLWVRGLCLFINGDLCDKLLMGHNLCKLKVPRRQRLPSALIPATYARHSTWKNTAHHDSAFTSVADEPPELSWFDCY